MPTRPSVFAAFLLGLVPVSLMAEQEPIPGEYAWLGVHLSQYWPYHEEISPRFIEEATLPGAQLGYRFPLNLSVQAHWERNEVRYPDSSRRVGVENSWVSVRHHLPDQAFGLEPYAGLSAGELILDTHKPNDETMLGLEAGVQKRIQPHWILDLGARVPNSLDNERLDIQAWIGVNHIFEFRRGGD